jgi:small subunit ribosomal protein S9
MATPTKKPAAAKKAAAAKTPEKVVEKTSEKTVAHKASAKTAVKKPAVHKTAIHKPVAHEHTPASEATLTVEAAIETAPKAAASRGASSILDLKGRYSYSVGRRKTSVANVRLYNGSEPSTVNQKKLADYFSHNAGYLEAVLRPLRLTGLEKEIYMVVTANGGGINSQAGAIAHGISHAIAKANSEFRKVLKQNGLLTRDSRMKERKKPGLKRARRGPQWAKR